MSDLEALRRALRERTAELAMEQAARLRAEDALVRAQRLEHIGRMTAGIAHDLNNLLLVAMAHADALSEARLPPEDARAEAGALLSVLSRAGSLTTRVMAVARGDDGDLRDLDPGAVVQDVVPVIRRMVQPVVALEVALQGDLWSVRGDAMQLEQVLLNLTSNARDAMPDGGTLRIIGRNVTLGADALRREFDPPPGEFVELALQDTGVGMSDAVRRRLFEPFFTTKPIGCGTGIGLVSSLGLVRRMGGTIMVETAEGAGSTFRVLLPRTVARVPTWPRLGHPMLMP
jgi:signal transduction histidine kinase